MSAYTQIRLNKTKEIKELLAFLKQYYKVLSEAEIIKKLLAEEYVNIKRKMTKFDDSDPLPEELFLQASKISNITSKDQEPLNFDPLKNCSKN